MTTYTISTNDTFDSREVSFTSKPQIAVLSAMKQLKMRWNPKRSVWYGFASVSEIEDAIQSAQPDTVPATICKEGYLGAIAVSGAKANRNLYGADLSAAIRADIKAAGIKGVSISVKSYSGGKSITATIKASLADLVDEETFISSYDYNDLPTNWIYTSDNDYLSRDAFFAMSPDDQIKTLHHAAKYTYQRLTKPGFHSINRYHVNTYTVAGAALAVKLRSVRDIINNFRYDNSNSMVDYFDTNFYYSMYVKIT